MDPIVAAALIAMIAGISTFLITLRGSRGAQMQAAGDSLRDDLLAQAGRLDTKIESLEAKVERQNERIRTLEDLNGDLRVENSRLRNNAVEDQSHIVILTDWGVNHPGAVPRTPPPWRPREA